MSTAAASSAALARTALIPLRARYDDARSAESILGDSAALALGESLSLETSLAELDTSTRAGCCLRSLVIDTWITTLSDQHPSLQVVDLGVGLNTRRERLGYPAERYVEIDADEIIELRSHFLDPDVRRLGGDVLDVRAWAPTVGTEHDGATAFVLEGVLAYHPPAKVSRFFRDVTSTFPTSYVLFDSFSPAAGALAWPFRRRRRSRPSFRWAPWSTRRIRVANDRWLQVIDEKGFLDVQREARRQLPIGQRILYSAPPLRHAYRLTLARL